MIYSIYEFMMSMFTKCIIQYYSVDDIGEYVARKPQVALDYTPGI